jgi:cell division protease FtsH
VRVSRISVDPAPGWCDPVALPTFRPPTNAVTVIDDEPCDPTADIPGGGAARRRTISDVGAWLGGLDHGVQPALRALGELLIGVAERADAGPETADRFTARCLGVVDCTHLRSEERPLTAVSRLTTAVALAEWIDEHVGVCEIGSGDYRGAPAWTQTEIGGEFYRHPVCLRVHFPAGTVLDDVGCVIGVDARDAITPRTTVSVFVVPQALAQARTVLDRLDSRATELNPYRGRALRASYGAGLSLAIIDLPGTASRHTVIVPDQVWAEVDLSVTAVRDRHAMLNARGLGARRGVLLCGPPGVGKSAVCAAIANEVVGEFTVIYVEALAGIQLLTVVVEEAQLLGGPVLLVLEDVDLWTQRRGTGSRGLSELLQAMDIDPEARILTLASTNDADTLDQAAIRTGRFDSVVVIGYPDSAAGARILAALTADLPGGHMVDAAAVVAALPERTSGSDIREIVRRAALSDIDGHVTTASLLAQVGNGRYRAIVPDGLYL